VALGTAGGAVAQTAAAPSPAARPAPPTPAEIASLRTIAQRGRLLFEIDRAARLTTQDVLVRIPNATSSGITGWIAEREGNGYTVTYYADGPGGPVAAYRAQVVGSRIVSRDVFPAASRPALTPVQRRMAAARAAVTALERPTCATQPFNVFAIPPSSPTAPIDVYKFTPQTQRDKVPLGGHYLVTVGSTGMIGNSRAFTNSCLDLTVGAPPAAGTQPTPLAVTHLLDPLPTEIHIFTSLRTGRPLLVATSEDRVWAVRGDRISLVPAR
jgi:hypothetical protein